MQTANLAAVEAAQAKLKQLEAIRAARPLCVVSRGLLAMALKSLAAIFENEKSGNSVILAFDGHLLSFDCNGLRTAVAATGAAWPARYELPMAAIADVLPVRLTAQEAEVGIWKSKLEIDRVRCPGVRQIK